MKRDLTPDDAQSSIWGGSVLASGGGGWVWHGELMGPLATTVGTPVLATVDELDDDDLVATVTAIGAPGAADWEIRPLDYVRALELLMDEAPGPIKAVMTGQNGSSTTLNGWIQSAVLGVLVLDAAGDIRAHPTGKLGSMGLTTRPGYRTVQAVAGGNRRLNGGAMEVVAKGAPVVTSNVLRDACVRAGGFIAAARHPVEASWVKANAAVGAITYALELGAAMRAVEGDAERVIDAACTTTGGSIVGRGPVHIPTPVRTEGGFDHGRFEVERLSLPFLNEYMAVDRDGERLSTYPDVIATLSAETGRPVAIADMVEGMNVAVFVVPRQRLILSSSTRDRPSLEEVEHIMGIEIVRHVGDILEPSR